MAKFCSKCGNQIDEKTNRCLTCDKNNKMPIPILIIVIVIFGILIMSTVGSVIEAKQKANKMSVENGKNAMLNDAEAMLLSAVLQKDGKTKCLYIYGYESSYENSGNYRGSIDISGDEDYIWLSDGNYLVKGTYDNLTIIESNLEATTNCRY